MNYELRIASFLDECRQRKLSSNTIKAYTLNLYPFCAFLREQNTEITEECIRSYHAMLLSRYQQASVNQKLSTLYMFLDFLVRERVICANPLRNMDIHQQKQNPKFQTVNANAVAAILKYAYRQKDLSEPGTVDHLVALRNIAILELLIQTGMRVSELCSLKARDISLTNRWVAISGTGLQQRTLKIDCDQTILALTAYRNEFWEQMASADRYFINRWGRGISTQSVRNMLKDYGEKAGVSDCFTPKLLRDSVASLLAKEGADITALQQLLGHNTLVQTMKYAAGTKPIASPKDLRKMLDEL